MLKVFVVLDVFCILLYVINIDAAILRKGNPIPWTTAKPHLKYVRESGVQQFISHYKRVKNVKTLGFVWGDELEYGIFKYNSQIRSYELSLRGPEMLENLEDSEKKFDESVLGCLWQPEYGAWMVEAVPRDPYSGFRNSIMHTEDSMRLRRCRLHSVLNSNEIAPSVGNFPLLGTCGLTSSLNEDCIQNSIRIPIMKELNIHQIEGKCKNDETKSDISGSVYIDDNVINPHPRFTTLTRNIRDRRGKKVDINIPFPTLQEDKKKSGDNTLNRSNPVAVDVDNSSISTIHMDAMAFGMGCCCLQVTMQCDTDRESRYVHDQLAVLAPLFLALSASTPIHKGFLSGLDTRWSVITQSVDDRTQAEYGNIPSDEVKSVADADLAGSGVKRLKKSRYSSISRFICPPLDEREQSALEKLNNIDANIDEEVYDHAMKNGLDSALAAHLGHLFVRDPLVIFNDSIYLDNDNSLEHFENIQSTNWRTMRWKPPSLEIGLEAKRSSLEEKLKIGGSRETNGDGNDNHYLNINTEAIGPGWRVEFRPLEIQLTDFENAAFAIVIAFLSRYILSQGCNFYMPLSYVEENMRRAEIADAVRTQKFYFPKRAFCKHSSNGNSRVGKGSKIGTIIEPIESDIIELTLDEIFNGFANDDGNDNSLINRHDKNRRNRQQYQPSCNEPDDNKFVGILPALLDFIQNSSELQNEISLTSSSHNLRRFGKSSSTGLFTKLTSYITLLQRRASGELPTAAQWIRSYVKSHPDYLRLSGNGITSNADSSAAFKVPASTISDLLHLCDDIGMGRVNCPELLGSDVNISKIDSCEIFNKSNNNDLVNSTAQISRVKETKL